MKGFPEIQSCPQLIAFIGQVGFLPLLESGIDGYNAEALMGEEYHYTKFTDGSWEWPLWEWKGSSFAKVIACMESFLPTKQALLAERGGQTSATGDEAKIPYLSPIVLKTLFCKHCVSMVA